VQLYETHQHRSHRTIVLRVSFALALACGARQAAPPEVEPHEAAAAARPAAGNVEPSARELDDVTLANAIAEGLVRACPPTPTLAASAAERQRCADGLTELGALRDAAHDPVFWGAQSPGAGADIERSRTTQMNGLVLRRLYLSTFAFGPEFRAERAGDALVLHVASRFRQALDPGDYPYPFWHSADKWRSYESTRELLFFIVDGSLRAVLRSEDQDPRRPHLERHWDGRWAWESSRGSEPHNALYQALFSANNPFVAKLDAAYRAFESAQRPSACVSCHDPANRTKVSPLELFSYPNQALTGRHDIVRALTENVMPPATSTTTAGITDTEQREALLELAQRFADLGDEALHFDREPVPAR